MECLKRAQEAATAESEPPPLVLTSKPIREEKPASKPAPKAKKAEEEAEFSPFSVMVGQVYDGPLDLLLDLIRKQDVDIYDIAKVWWAILTRCQPDRDVIIVPAAAGGRLPGLPRTRAEDGV